MNKYFIGTFIFLVIFITGFYCLPFCLASELLTKKIYTHEYDSIPDTDEYVAERLYGLSLQEAVNKKIVKINHMKSLALPLGIVGTKKKRVNFVKGMRDMWNDKRGIKKSNQLKKLRNRFVHKVKRGTARTCLRRYREDEIAQAVSLVKKLFDKKKKSYHPDKISFMELIVKNLTPNVMLGYNIQELLPPSYKKVQINPVFKAYFYNKLLCEGGREFVEGYPARYDSLISFGPFQMTNMAMGEITKYYNKFLSKKDRLPRYVKDMKNMQQHANAAILFAYYNWALMANTLKKQNTIRKFNRYFPGLDLKKKQIFIAGITACMHHLPAPTRTRVSSYIKKNSKFDIIHYDIRRKAFDDKFQLQKYYDSAAESYLLMKVFHILDDRYSKGRCKK